MNKTFEQVMMIGPAGNRGGIASVINTIRSNYNGISFISSYPENKNESRVKHFIQCLISLHKTLTIQNNIQIIHLHVASKGSFVRKSIVMMLAKAHGRKTILHMHGGAFHTFYTQSIIHKFFIKWILNWSDAVICLSDDWKRFYHTICQQKNIMVIGNPVNSIQCKKFSGKKEKVQLLFLGKICNEKGIFELVDTLSKNGEYLKGKIKLTIAGFGETEKLNNLIKSKDSKGNIEFIGWIEGEEKVKTICNSDIYILPSHFEGLPISIIESMMCKKPIIATNVGGVATLVENKYNGWLYEAGDNYALDQILTNITDNKELLEEYGNRSYLKASTFTPEKIKENLLALYQTIQSKITSNMRINDWGYLRLKLIDMIRGTNMIKALKELKQQQYWSKEKLKDIETERFNEILNDAANSSINYKNTQTYEGLKILTKEVLKNYPENFISTNYSSNLTTKATSGSTGSPLIYYTTKEAQSYMWAGIILSWEIAGYKLGDSVAFLAGTSLFKKDVKHKVFHKLFNIKTYSTFSLNDEDIKYYIDDINKNKIKIIYGYATALNKMAEYILDKKETKFPTLKGIVSSAEVLTEEHRRNIQEAFGVRVYNQYGCNEGGVSAFECEENHLHLINTKCKYEIDQDGNLIASDLINKGFFMLRYFTGDKLIMDENKQCSCGRGFPVIEKVIGRSYDIVVDNKNKILHAAFFNILFKQDPSIRQFQIQFDKKMISINLKVDEVYAKPERYSKYVDIIKQHLCFDEYNLKLNAPFMISQNAKHKYVVNTAA